MIPQPRKTKFKKWHKGRIKYGVKATQTFSQGDYAIIAEESARITARQIAAAELAIKRRIKRGGKIWRRVYPHIPVTKKPSEVRMGKGKGSVNYWVARVQAGAFLFELKCLNAGLALTALQIASTKLPIKTILYRKAATTSKLNP